MPRLKAPRTTGRVILEGPLFRGDPGARFSDNIRTMMAAVAVAGEHEAQDRIASIPPHGVKTGATRRKIVGRVKSRTGRQWRATAVVGIPNVGSRAESIASHAALASIEHRYRVMRDTASSLRRVAGDQAQELLRGVDR